MTGNRGDIETNYEVRSYDAQIGLAEYNRLERNPLYIVLDNLRSAFNVGAIFRLCDAMRVKGLILCGYTAHPPHIKLAKTSLGTTDYVPWRHVADTLDAIAWLREQGVAVYAAETSTNAVRHDRVRWPSEVALVLGNEALGVERRVIDRCDKVVELPMYGFKNSINVATACAVLGYRFLEKHATATQTALRRGAEEP